MKKTLASAAMLMSLMFGSTVLRADDTVTVYGISPTTNSTGSWYEQFEITIDPGKVSGKPKATAKEIKACPVKKNQSLGGGILVVGSDVYYSLHTGDSNVYLNGAVLFDAKTASGGYGGFSKGIADLSGDATHIWANPRDGTGKVFEFVLDEKLGWTFNKQTPFNLNKAGKKYDGMEKSGNRIYANRQDAGFDLMAASPCSGQTNAIYDVYDATNGNVVQLDFIRSKFPGTGIVFNGTYFFVSDVCHNGIAVYDKNGAFLAEADLGALPAGSIACQAPPKSFCINSNLKRCLEDLSLLVESSGPSGQDSVPAAARKEMAPTLQLSGTPPVGVRVGETHPLAMSVQADGVGVPGAPVTFTSVMGDVHFVSGQLSQDGRQSTVSADENGQATVQYVTGQPGLSIVEVTSTGASQRISISASNVGVPESH
jgi:hypothetical protein